MNPTPTQAETPTPRLDASEALSIKDGDYSAADYERLYDLAQTLERELATAQAELTTLREKLAEEQAGAASMREALDALVNEWMERAKCNAVAGHQGALMEREVLHCVKGASLILSSTTGKATLEELERLRSLRHHASLKLTNREDGDGMTGDEILAAIDDMQRKARSDFERIEALRAEVEEAIKARDHNRVCVERLAQERDSALARVKTLEGALPDVAKLRHLADWLDIYDAKTGNADFEVQSDLRRWARNAEQALQPTAPTEPEKAGSAEPPPATVPLALAEGLAEALEYVLPLAKGYAAQNPHASNIRMIVTAEDRLAAYRANHPKP